MKRLLLSSILLTFSLIMSAQNKDEKAILDILDRQTKSWNEGNLDAFMNGYWQNDSLVFIGKSGLSYGYANALSNYQKTYSDTAQMGKLNFNILQLKRLSHEYYYVIGKWYLKRSVGDISGQYTLLFRKINGRWTIIADHSS